jgi:glycosyltransferase involved in cell wall biosynthesis
VINNVFSIKKAPEINFNIASPIKLFWFSQTVGMRRGLEDVLIALKKFPLTSFSITVMGDLSSNMEKYLNRLITENNEIKVDLNFIGPVEPDQIFELASAFDIGLAIEPALNENNNVIFTNKLFTYLLSGNAILFTSTTAQQSFFNQHRDIGWIYPSGDIDKLELVLKQIKSNPLEILSFKQNAQQLAKQVYNWEIEQTKLMNHLGLIEVNA